MPSTCYGKKENFILPINQDTQIPSQPCFRWKMIMSVPHRLPDPAKQPYLCSVHVPSSDGDYPFKEVPLRAKITESDIDRNNRKVLLELVSNRQKVFGSMRFEIEDNYLKVHEFGPAITCDMNEKLMCIATSFFTHHLCSAMGVTSSSENIIDYMRLGFYPLEDEFEQAVRSQSAETFNHTFKDPKSFTEKDFNDPRHERIFRRVCRKLHIERKALTYETFVKEWDFSCNTALRTYRISQLARDVFKKAPGFEKSSEMLLARGSINLYLPDRTLQYYKDASSSFPKMPSLFSQKVTSLWLPSQPKPKIVNIKSPLEKPHFCDLAGPLFSGNDVIYELKTPSSVIGRIVYNVHPDQITIQKLEFEGVDHQTCLIIAKHLLDVAIEAAITNIHCDGRVAIKAEEGTALEEACKFEGFEIDLSRRIKSLSLGGRQRARSAVTYRLSNEQSELWKKRYYVTRLAEELTYLIDRTHPTYNPKDLKTQVTVHNTIVTLLTRMDLFLAPLYPNLNIDDLSFYDHLSFAIEGHKKHFVTRNKPELLNCEIPEVIYLCVYIELCKLAKVEVDPKIERGLISKRPNYALYFNQIRNVPLAELILKAFESFPSKVEASVFPLDLKASREDLRGDLSRSSNSPPDEETVEYHPVFKGGGSKSFRRRRHSEGATLASTRVTLPPLRSASRSKCHSRIESDLQ